MAPGGAESDFGLQGWIGTLGLKQIFLSSIVGKEKGSKIGRADKGFCGESG